MSLRKAAWIAYGGMKVDSPARYHPITDDTTVMEALAERCKMHRCSPSVLDLVQHILIPLWQCNIYHLSHLMESNGSSHSSSRFILNWTIFSASHPQAGPAQRKAIHLATRVLCHSRINLRLEIESFDQRGPDFRPAERMLPPGFLHSHQDGGSCVNELDHGLMPRSDEEEPAIEQPQLGLAGVEREEAAGETLTDMIQQRPGSPPAARQVAHLESVSKTSLKTISRIVQVDKIVGHQGSEGAGTLLFSVS